MYDIRLNQEILKENNITLSEVIALIAIQYNLNLNEALNVLKDKGYVGNKYFEGKQTGQFFISQQGTDLLNDIIYTNVGIENNVKISNKRLENLAIKLIELYPKGTKPNTNQSWRSSVKDIEGRLKSFFRIYGNKYTDEQIIQATQNYVLSYQNDMRFMKTLYYFIWKEKGHYDGGTVARQSELAVRLENSEEPLNINLKEDWTSQIV